MPKLNREIAPSCPVCNKELSGFTGITGEGEPEEGDITLCIYCASVLQFTSTLDVVELSAEEIATFSPGELEAILKAQRIINLTRERYEREKMTTEKVDKLEARDEFKKLAKGWINDNKHDGEDRSQAENDMHFMTAPDLYKIVDEMIDDIFFEIESDHFKSFLDYSAKHGASDELLTAIGSWMGKYKYR